MSKFNDLVREFHEAFDHPINEVKDDIPKKVRVQRLNLLFEELGELADAMDVPESFAKLCAFAHEKWKDNGRKSDGDNVNKKEELDALGDIQYVLSGAIIALGHYANFDKAFDDIQDSNMSKMCATLKEVDDTIKFHTTKDNEPVAESNIKYTKKGDKYIVYRVSDDKVLKNVHYKEVDLTQYV